MNSEKHSDNGRRMRRSKKSIKKHFIDLILEKGYKNVTVTDIVQRADYNRSTFYMYFKDKEDLMNEIVEEKLEELEYSFQLPFKDVGDVELAKLVPKSVAIFNHIYENKVFYSLLIVDDPIPGFYQKFLSKIRKLFDALNFKSNTKENSNAEHHKTFLAYGEVGLILEWVKSDFEISSLELAENILDVLTTHFHSVGLVK